MYRPEGWENPELEFEKKQEDWRKHGIVASCAFSTPANAYEAGADAMLEGLKKDKESCYVDRYNEPKGWLVFIPEEKE